MSDGFQGSSEYKYTIGAYLTTKSGTPSGALSTTCVVNAQVAKKRLMSRSIPTVNLQMHN